MSAAAFADGASIAAPTAKLPAASAVNAMWRRGRRVVWVLLMVYSLGLSPPLWVAFTRYEHERLADPTLFVKRFAGLNISRRSARST
jgi:hypothetical protein